MTTQYPRRNTLEVIRAPCVPKSKNLVFTSAGDRANLHHWVKGKRDFDLWVAYYGERPGALQHQTDFFALSNGSKFQNLHSVYQQYGSVISQYDAVMVLDDDILIDATGLTLLFEIRRAFDLWVVQPAFRLSGKISWDITRVSPTTKLRYTNFVEMTCPLFRRDKLDAFMAEFDTQLVGYGEDWWFLKTLGPDLRNHVAIADEVTCVNPYDSAKGGTREIDRLQSHEERIAAWERVKLSHGLDEHGRRHIEYSRINNSVVGATTALFRYFPDWAYFNAKRLAQSLFR